MVRFERALFLSWYCSRRDCTFCYMSTLKTSPKKSRRRKESVYAEAMISHKCNWPIEFISGGYDSYDLDELIEITRGIHAITGEKQWLNMGALSEEELSSFLPHICGVAGTLECANPEIREKVCPSKPLEEIENMFRACDILGLKKAVTLIIGLGETRDDLEYLLRYLKTYSIDKITFYALNPHPGTPFRSSPSIDYYEWWISSVRKAFPHIDIVAGAWSDKISYYSRLITAGADNITKLPALKILGTDTGRLVKEEIEKVAEFHSILTQRPDFTRKEIEDLPFDQKTRDLIAKKITTYGSKII